MRFFYIELKGLIWSNPLRPCVLITASCDVRTTASTFWAWEGVSGTSGKLLGIFAGLLSLTPHTNTHTNTDKKRPGADPTRVGPAITSI